MVRRIDRTSSIETEPRTLNLQQIQFAREAALYVVNTTTTEDAIRIFTKGMEPVAMQKGLLVETKEEYWDQNWNCCSFKNATQQLRHVFTAPF